MKTEYNGRLYDSKREAEYAAELDLLQRAGEVTAWRSQVPFDLHVNGVNVARYVADFMVARRIGDYTEIVDIKGGPLTAIFRLKQKMFEAEYGIKIKIVR